MKEIDISDISVGITTEKEFYSKNGDLLISKSVNVTEKHLEALRRRNIFKLFQKESKDDDEIQKLLSADVRKLDELNLDENPRKAEPEVKPLSAKPETLKGPPKALERKEFKNIKKGREGLEQLSRSKKASLLDDALKQGQTADTPVGPALSEEAREMGVEERTEEYKKAVSSSYAGAVQNVSKMLNCIANGDQIEGSAIRKIVEDFIETYVTDKNILINISSIKHMGDEYIYNHTLNVCLLALNISAASGYSREQVVEIGMGALLHDIGMLLVPEEIRKKPGKLSSDELFEIQKHPIIGLHLLEQVKRLPISVPYIAYQSHERENGKGYPKQRNKRFIHKFAKIIQIADIYEALSSPRPYRNAYMPYKAMETIIKMTRKGIVSGEFVKNFLTYSSLFPVGSIVELNDHRLAKVIKANGHSFSKPVITILTDKEGNVLPKEQFQQEHLSENTELQIIRAHKNDHLKDVQLMDGF